MDYSPIRLARDFGLPDPEPGPIRLGGKRVLRLNEKLVSVEMPEPFDTRRWLAGLGFDHAETDVMIAIAIEGYQRQELPAALGKPEHETERIRARVNRKLKKIRSKRTQDPNSTPLFRGHFLKPWK